MLKSLLYPTFYIIIVIGIFACSETSVEDKDAYFAEKFNERCVKSLKKFSDEEAKKLCTCMLENYASDKKIDDLKTKPKSSDIDMKIYASRCVNALLKSKQD